MTSDYINKIFNCDCLEGLKDIPDNSVDCIITDPPYCVGATSNGIKANYTDLNLIRPFFDLLFKESARVLKDNGYIYCCTDWRTYPILYPTLINILSIRNLIVWEHRLLRPGNWYRGSHELIMFATKVNAKRKFGGGERDIWRIRHDSSELPPNRVHPSQKPVALIEKIINDSTNEGEIVLDPFIGSGTTAVACIQTNRKFVGYELNKKFFEICQKRIDETLAEKQQELFTLKDF